MPRATSRISFEEGISRKDLKTIRQRFLRLHRERLARILQELRPRQQEFLELLPLLLHINHPMLPGFVKSDTPKGLPDYNPSRRTLLAARRLSRSFSYKRRAQRIFQIQALYLMGSTGSIGQSSLSDFDLWLCHDSRLNREQLRQLQQKAVLIERAGESVGLELHIFLIDPLEFRAGKKAKLSRESSGSTQHNLLLEEFYRSAILLAGRYPLWWLVPPEQELEYRAYAANLLHHRFIRAGETIDLGGLDQVPAEEFFGAALWQLYKGIDSPYKSILKVFLMEAYSQDYPHPRWLAQQAKEAIYQGEDDPNQLDAYLLLFGLVEQYLIEIDDAERLELARRCFYFKVGERLSLANEQPNWRRQKLLQMTRQWGWSQAQLQLLDGRADWKIERVVRERNLLVGVLSRSYRLLTEFARKYAGECHIDPHELNLLGRKLYTALDHRPGKIDQINPGISSNLVEPQLSVHLRPARDGALAWTLYRGEVDDDLAQDERPIKITHQLIELLLWSHVNQIWGPHSRVKLYPADCPVREQELFDLQRSLRRLFPEPHLAGASMQALAEPARVQRVALFLNIGMDPFAQLSKEGMQLTSDRHDPLSFASGQSNLVLQLEAMLQTSWGELLVSRHEGDQALLEVLVNLLDMQSPGLAPPIIHAFSYSCVRGTQIAARVVELCEHIIGFFAEPQSAPGRYIFRQGRGYFIVQPKDPGHSWYGMESFEQLLQELEQPQTRFHRVAFDPEILGDTPYPTLYRHNQQGTIQLFFHARQAQMEIYLLDEQGALFRQTLAVDGPRFLMRQQRRFLNSLQQLRNLLPGGNADPLGEPEFYELQREHLGTWRVERRRVPLARPDDYLELTLVSDHLDPGSPPQALICGEREFTRLEYGEGLYAATAEYLHQQRAGEENYPIYLTSLRLSGLPPLQPPSTVELLNLKKRVEQRLNQPPTS